MPPSKLYQAKLPASRFDPGGTADRLAATTDGLTLAMQQMNASMIQNGVIVDGATKIVAASNSTAAMRAVADYICDNVNDEAEINAALAALPGIGGTVLLSEGLFNLAAPVITTGARQAIRGMGMGATTLRVINAAPAAVNVGLVQLTASACELTDLTIDCNIASNASQTNMRCVHITHASVLIERPTVQRVRMLNAVYGLVITNTVAVNHAVIRDCLVEGATNAGMYLRGGAGCPTVASGCTSKGHTSYGFMLDSGPVLMSDCHALNGTGGGGAGFYVASTPIGLTNCTAQGNAGYGFAVPGSRAQLVGCRSISNANLGFVLLGAQPLVVNCVAIGTSGSDPTGYGFRVDSGATDPLFQGCDALDNAVGGFYHNAATTGMYVDCRAINNAAYPFRVSAGNMHMQGCYAYGAGATSIHGVLLDGGSDHTVDGSRIANNGQAGIHVNSGVNDVQITSNYLIGSSLNANSSINQMRIFGARVFVHKNVLRDPSSGNRPWGGIVLEGGSADCFVGLNDTNGTGNAYEIYNGGTNTRRAAKLQLDYAASVDLLNQGVAANTWADVGGAGQGMPLSFRVDSPTSLILIDCQGSLLAGAFGFVNAVVQCQLLVDGVNVYRLGGEIIESASYYQNALIGSQPVAVENLGVGTHTIKLQVRGNAAMTAYLRAQTAAHQEYLFIQVMEYFR